MPPRRIAFVVNSSTNGELKAGNRDVARIFTVLTDPVLGACSPESPAPLHACKGYANFHEALLGVLEGWQEEDQFVFYFSGHGSMIKGQYCLQSGPRPADNIPFANILNLLGTHGVTRAVVIIDACHSGGALATKGDLARVEVAPEESIPQGTAILASSRTSELSYELPTGAGSVFTTLLCEGIESGLDETPTEDSLIGVDDIIGYVRKKLQQPKYAEFSQTPMYTINRADRSIWLAKNKSGARRPVVVATSVSIPVRNLDELRHAYETTVRAKHPCSGARVDDIDWALVDRYVATSHEKIDPASSRDGVISQLGFFSPLSPHDRPALHNAAVLCFCKRPERHIPQARAVFIAGDPSGDMFERTSVYGPLSHQIQQLTDLTLERLGTIARFDDRGSRQDEPTLPANLVREVVSNAIVHRDYESNANVHVRVMPDAIEVESPGLFPHGMTWDTLVAGGRRSYPIDAAIALYVSNLLQFEGVGRGFDVFRQYIAENAPGSLSCVTETNPPTVRLRIARRNSAKLQPQNRRHAAEFTTDFAILTGLQTERRAVCAVFGFGDENRVKRDGRSYWRGRLPLANGEAYEIVVAQSSDMGNVEAALLASDVIRQWSPSAALLVGIAASAREGIEPGDVVVGRGIYYFERGKATRDTTLTQPEIINSDMTLLQHAMGMADWSHAVSVARPDGKSANPNVHFGVIASGEKVIANAAARDAIASQHRKILAIDMEGYGFSQAFLRGAEIVRTLTIRAICDDASGAKGDNWHDYAAAAAAEFAKQFLLDRPLAPRTA